jgi:AcrR family transcriptional regulator
VGNVVADVPAGYPGDVGTVEASRSEPDGAPAAGRADAGAAGAEPAPAAETTAQVVEFAVRTAPTPVDPDDLVAATELAEPAAPDAEQAVEVPVEVPAEVTVETPRKAGRRRVRPGPNKREVRHQQTREAIVDAAATLFSERGFDAVSVQEIAQRAGVVEKTVFNHFPVKEGLVFEADPPMRAALVAAVRRRPAGESAAAAAGSFVVAAVSQLGSPAAAAGVAEMARVIRGSRTLQVREREILGTLTDALAEEIALETHAPADAIEPWLTAHAVLGLYAAMMELARDRVLGGASGPDLVTELRTCGRRGLALLQFGLAGYAKRR